MKRAIRLIACVILLALAAAGAIQAASGEEPLCLRNSQDGCDNNGCEATGGVCGRAEGLGMQGGASPCWCLY